MPSDFERAYLMARQAYLLGPFSETEEDFARRIAEIGARQGVRAAAEAISKECKTNGIRMSPQSALDILAQAEQNLGRHQQQPPQPGPAHAGPGPDHSPENLDEERSPRGHVASGFVIAAVAVMAAMVALSMVLR